jgi:DNA primase
VFARAMAETFRRVGVRRVTLDVKMNGHGQQIVAPYSIRPLETAAVATPLHWTEVCDTLDPAAFTPRVVRARVKRAGDVAASLLHSRQSLAGIV